MWLQTSTFPQPSIHKVSRFRYERLALLRDDGIGEKREELEALERALATHKELLRQVTSYPNRKLKRPDFLPYEPADAWTDAPAAPPPAGRSERWLKPIQELCNGYFLSLMTEQLAQTEVRLRGDVTTLRGASITRSLQMKLELTNFLFEQPEDDEEEEEDDGEEAMLRERGNQPSSESCAEAEEVASGEMAGSISSGDSIQVIGTERSYRTLAAPGAPLASSLPLAGASDAAPSVAANGAPPPGPLEQALSVPLATTGAWLAARDTPPPSFDSPPVTASDPRRFRVYAGRANSEDSIEVLSTTESIVPEDLAAITEEEGEEPTKDDEMAGMVKNAHAGSADQTPPNLLVERRSSAQSGEEAWRGGAGRRRKRGAPWDKAGLLAQRFTKQHSFSQHVVFCLLSGRPLVLLSGDEDKLRKTVDALALFLPAPAGAVMPCLRAPLQLCDLLAWRLIGFHR